MLDNAPWGTPEGVRRNGLCSDRSWDLAKGAEQAQIGHGWIQKSKLREANPKQLCMYSQQILRTEPDPSPVPSSCSSLLRLMYQKLLYILHGVLNIQWMAFPELSSRCYLGLGIKKTIYTFLCICAGTAWTPWTKRTASKLVVGGREGRRGRNLYIWIYLSGPWKYSFDNYISFISRVSIIL